MANLIATRSSLQNQSIINFFKGSSLNVIDYLTIQAFVSTPDGIKMIRATDTGPCTEHLSLANNVAQLLIDQGAKNILGLEHG